MSIRRIIHWTKQVGRKFTKRMYPIRHATLPSPIFRRSGGSNERWLDDNSFDRSWNERSSMMVRRVRPGSRVVDVGAGAQALRLALPVGCIYLPIDIVQRSPDTIACDLNRDEPPHIAADYLIASGLIEYITDVDRLIKWMTSVAPSIVISYETANGETRYHRRKSGWVNAYTDGELREILNRNSLSVIESATWRRQTIYWLQRTRALSQ